MPDSSDPVGARKWGPAGRKGKEYQPATWNDLPIVSSGVQNPWVGAPKIEPHRPLMPAGWSLQPNFSFMAWNPQGPRGNDGATLENGISNVQIYFVKNAIMASIPLRMLLHGAPAHRLPRKIIYTHTSPLNGCGGCLLPGIFEGGRLAYFPAAFRIWAPQALPWTSLILIIWK